MKKRIIVVIFLFFVFVYNSYAVTISNCQTITNPGTYTLNQDISSSGNCITIASSNVIIDGNDGLGVRHRITVSGGGDAVHFRAGNFNNIIVRNIISNEWIGTDAINSISQVVIQNNDVAGVWIWGFDDLTLKDNHLAEFGVVTDTDACQSGTIDAPYRFKIINNTIESSHLKMTQIIGTPPESGCGIRSNTNGLVENNTFINNIVTADLGGAIATSMYFGFGATNNVFRNNRFISTGAAMTIFMRDGADYNLFENNFFYSNDPARSVFFWGSGSDWWNVRPSHNIFRNNTFIGQNTDAMVTQGIGTDNLFENNLFYSGKPGVYGHSDIGGTSTILRHNTFYTIDSISPVVNFYADGSITVTNNIFVHANSNKMYTCGSGAYSGYSGNNNLFYGNSAISLCGVSLSSWRTNTGDDANSIQANPLFANAAAKNFRLEAGSPACNINGDYAGAYPCGSIPSSTCTETDAGIDYNNRGVIYINGVASGEDYCTGNQLIEYYCSGSSSTTASTQTYTCPGVCLNGACTSAPDTTSPTITGILTSSITSNSAVISWNTNEISSSLVKYGTVSGIYPNTATGSSGVTSHSIALTLLNPGTKYYYVVNSSDPSKNTAQSNEQNFTTSSSSSYSCGVSCSGCLTNNIKATSCTTPNRGCDGTNIIQDIRLSSSTITGGDSLTVSIDYGCYPANPPEDNVALWYYNGTGWKLIKYWPAPLTGCDTITNDIDGTLSFTFTPDSNAGTHYVRAIEAAGSGTPPKSDSSPCPNLVWGNIDDLGFTVVSSSSTLSYTLNLQKGLNLISIPLVSSNNDIGNLFSSILKDIKTIYTYDPTTASWNIYHSNPLFPSSFNRIEPYKSYFILMNNTASVTIQGNAATSARILKRGWNLIGIQGLVGKTINTELSGVSYNSIWKYNTITKQYEQIIDTNTILQPGVGYWIDAI